MKRLTTTICLTIAVLLGSVGVGYALPPCPEDESAYWHNCYGTFAWANGDKYVGEWVDGKKDGQGTETFADGAKYVGEYRDNKRHGQGTFTLSNGDKYVGGYRNGKRNGQGTVITTAGGITEGIWRDGTFESSDHELIRQFL